MKSYKRAINTKKHKDLIRDWMKGMRIGNQGFTTLSMKRRK